MSLRKALLAATVLALPVAAQAQPVTGLYVGAGAGINWLMESDLTSQGALRSALSGASVSPNGAAEFDTGWVGVLSLGYGFGNGVRVEVEGNYRQNSINGITGFGANAAGAPGLGAPRTQGGDVYSYGAMLNAFYDFNLGPASFFHPYVGLGIGYVVQNWDNVRINGPRGSVVLDGDNGNFAYQAIVGAAFPISAVPGLAITAEYRFMGALSDDVDAQFINRSGATVATSRGAVEVENMNHSLLLGVRYAFNAAPPPPPVVAPAAAPAPARTFLVFFDFDRATLTDRARQIIGEAAQNAQRGGVTRIEVSGHADRSGTPQYNQRLSERRAQAVAAELERRGIPRSAMTIQAFGESRPLVPTADGVREPQNRRVEIVLR
ncbi:OmpA family protein [Falsiroseomonas oryziterrae]|uniref:OmpA family protein n=1 Tax=Falsiroseomonas oryziterrae TaxID=2911368 RepID=UPI001F2E4C7F|nr:OmpA family protein [Roseomonas sp. NPKOSM-4]